VLNADLLYYIDLGTCQNRIDWLDRVCGDHHRSQFRSLLATRKTILARMPSEKKLCSNVFKILRRLCRASETLPQSCRLAHPVKLESQPVSQSALSDVFCGQYNGQKVAVKMVRLHRDNMAAVKKVLLFCNAGSSSAS
jgi:hypothetical protein